jgi:hypothetical protein
MIVVCACRGCLAALLIGAAAASSARVEESAESAASGQEVTNPAQEAMNKAAPKQELKRKLKVRMYQLSRTAASGRLMRDQP